jgi:hypothetical protein
MSEDYQKVETYANWRFSKVISEGFSFFGKNWAKFLLLFASFLIISIILKSLLITDIDWQRMNLEVEVNLILKKNQEDITDIDLFIMMQYLSITIVFMFLDGLIKNFFGVFSMCLFGAYVYKKFIGESTKLISEVKNAFNTKMILVLLLLGLGVSLGLFLIYIPSIIIIGFYSFLIFTYNSRNNENPVKRARNIAKGSFWKVFGIFIISNLVIWVIDLIYHLVIDNFIIISQDTYYSWFNPASRNIGLIVLYNCIDELMELLLSPLFVCLLCSLYVHLSFRDHTVSQKNIQSSYEKEIRSSSVSISKMKGLYCPYCGKYMTEKKEICPNCGGTLSFEI